MSNRQNLSTSIPWPEAAIPQGWVESLFAKMACTYGAKFADQWGGVEPDGMKRHWAEALGVMSNQELVRGVQSLATRDWPPTLPEFLKLCRPFLDPQIAYQEALVQGGLRERGEPNEWSSPAIYWAWRRIGKTAFRDLSYAVIKPRWEAALAAEFAKQPCAPIPVQALALPVPGRTMSSVPYARQQLALYIAMTKGFACNVAADHRQWARKIIARHAAGEQLELEQIKCAEQALGGR